jgi:hypothetical protein
MFAVEIAVTAVVIGYHRPGIDDAAKYVVADYSVPFFGGPLSAFR